MYLDGVDGCDTRLCRKVLLACCGLSVFACTDDEIKVHLGSLDATDHLIPTYESWTVRRAAWLRVFRETTLYKRDRKSTGRFET
ncbi:MAG: hypothetical protein P8M25_08425 [Paracoccaceae bacterium]|jgi:hypothetical protein|nr:hypothetical protein [Paracoccaceae bacterium]